jgi:tRNA dimethylallyltransferase
MGKKSTPAMEATRKPIIAVIGTTGVGKTKLAIHIAELLNGQIINGDSMQVYRGLDIITNKPTLEEKKSVPHHLFDFLEPDVEYSVVDYTRDALKAINDIHEQNAVPVIVGGTNYYIHSLLWEQTTIEEDLPKSSKFDGMGSCHPTVAAEMATKLAALLESTNPLTLSVAEISEFVTSSGSQMHAALTEIDPVMAERWHVNDTRKIRRSLEIYFTTGQKHSDLLASQKTTAPKLRFPTCVFWLYGDSVALNPRLDARVDQMISQGMFIEMHAMLDLMREGKVSGIKDGVPDYTRGILQSIGAFA